MAMGNTPDARVSTHRSSDGDGMWGSFVTLARAIVVIGILFTFWVEVRIDGTWATFLFGLAVVACAILGSWRWVLGGDLQFTSRVENVCATAFELPVVAGAVVGLMSRHYWHASVDLGWVIGATLAFAIWLFAAIARYALRRYNDDPKWEVLRSLAWLVTVAGLLAAFGIAFNDATVLLNSGARVFWSIFVQLVVIIAVAVAIFEHLSAWHEAQHEDD